MLDAGGEEGYNWTMTKPRTIKEARKRIQKALDDLRELTEGRVQAGDLERGDFFRKEKGSVTYMVIEGRYCTYDGTMVYGVCGLGHIARLPPSRHVIRTSREDWWRNEG